jgi:L-alanine-DL-glutamate epimerase-like enolase superfamily enzyme
LKQATDIHPVAAELYFIPVETRVPLKFGSEVLTHVTCARVRMTVHRQDGTSVYGWGETPLSVQWVWPGQLAYQQRFEALKAFCLLLNDAWADFSANGHAMEIGHAFQQQVLPVLLEEFNAKREDAQPMPWLAALVCCSAFDLALHDAYGKANDMPVYQTYGPPYMNKDLSHYLQPAADTSVSFRGKYPRDFLDIPAPEQIPVWHLVGGVDPLSPDELTGNEPDDGYPVLLSDWIERDGLNCLKIKLRGDDYEWDYRRLVRVGEIAIEHDVDWLTSDFNCTVEHPDYVNAILDQLVREHPRIYGMILYVEQPFPYDLAANRIDVHSVSARKPLFMDESAHDWEVVRLGRELGWTGVALKTCKTQTGALLSLCWAKAHGMTLMVQDLTNPMLAQIPHVLLGAHAGTIMGVESNAMQFYPDASAAEEKVHPGLYRRREGHLDLSTLEGPGFGYRLDEIDRQVPEPVARSGHD